MKKPFQEEKCVREMLRGNVGDLGEKGSIFAHVQTQNREGPGMRERGCRLLP